MPCCGLHEYRQRVPLKYAVAGFGVFWGAFVVAFLSGIVLIGRRRGRSVLKILTSFLRALWMDTMRSQDSLPARWNCRCSGYLLGLSPKLAATVYHHPEIGFVYVPISLVIGLVVLAWWLRIHFFGGARFLW